MRCNNSKFLFISVLTFMAGIGIVNFSDKLLNLFFAVEQSRVSSFSKLPKSTESPKQKKLCEEYEGFKSSLKAKHTIKTDAPINQKIICLTEPIYPPSALAVKASGEVKVEVLLDESGDIVSAKPISGHPLLRESAVTSVYKSRFAPTLLGGERVKVKGIFIVNFVLPN